MSHRLSPTGRRNALALLLGAICVWVFAFWALQNTLGTVQGEPNLGFFAAVQRNIAAGLTLSQIIPALLMVALIVATPLVFWNILEEYAAVYTPTGAGLRYESVGVSLLIPWDAIEDVVPREDSGETSFDVRFNRDTSAQVRQPWLRWLHGQAVGRRELHIPSGIEQRHELIAAITARGAITSNIENEHDRDDGMNTPRGTASRA